MRAKFQTFELSILSAARLAARLPNVGRNAGRPSKVPDCKEPAKARRWCNAHYSRWWRTGDPLPPVYPRPTVEQVVTECMATYDAALTTIAVMADLDSSLAQP